MKAKVFLSVLLGFSAVMAQTSQPQPALTVDGVWPFCENPAAAAFGSMCTGFVPGHETYALMIPNSNPTSEAYMYTIKATLVSTGQEVTIHGVIERNNNPSNYTMVTGLFFGGVITQWQVQVDNLVVYSLRSQLR